ncbi:LOW QUALITY PROTEIN: cinnamoyl-CoA reductase 2-like [Phalaenopsis equestris]|uniref:LOW QUALITY PROTEIN: cinnamoyl-CoA reductase 2-like n=1 Tax=Phalaenopsis equestris TaxID=78828 RepID=UPI0009E425B7|nr:LOW QUALITY PROTEIN: cinnamoyl-CoA reductase 2-like [Phalaenopsis equestris]
MEARKVCVTGAGGYIASWLVKLLLSEGYKVNGTVRNPSDEKNGHLKKLENASENLQLYKADVLQFHDLLAAIQGCEGVFHVASPVPGFKVVPNPESEVIAPALTGTINVMKACSEVGVKRVLVVSSIAAVFINPDWPKDKVIDESCWSDQDWMRRGVQYCYALSKTLAERAAWEYAEKTGLNLVTVCPSMVYGPQLQTTVNSSSLMLLNIVKGAPEPMLDKLWHLVDVRDVADALLLVYESADASGRYISSAHSSYIHDMITKLKSIYPNYKYQQNFIEPEVERERISESSSEKLKMLGWKTRPFEETLVDSIEFYQQAGLLEKN